MQFIQCFWTSLLYFCYILDITGTAPQTCPTKCNCKYDNGNQPTDITCVNIQFGVLYSFPVSVRHLTITGTTNAPTIPLGELRQGYLNRKHDLRTLTIENYGIEALGGQCFQHNTKLTTLSLTNNLLQNLTEDNFHGLVKLEYLDLTQNKLTVLRSFVFRQLTALKELKVLLNQLTAIGENSFKGLNSIEKIDLTSNQISSIHKDAFTGLSTLKEIILLSNKVLRLEGGTFSNLYNLLALNLRNNKLVYIDSDSMTGMASLNDLNLAQNSLRTLPKLFLQKTSSLQLEIDLSRNNLTILSDGDLTHVYLKTLYLVGNQIQIVQPDAIKDSYIQKLDLQQNQLKHFPEAIQQYLNQSKTLLLANNPWICDCDIYWMASILTNQTQAPVCVQPIIYKGWTVSYFSKNVTMSCYFGSLPVPTKAIPVPPKQGIVTPALETKSPSDSDPMMHSSTTIETDTNKGENYVSIVVGIITVLSLLIILTVIYVYIKHGQSKVHCEHMEYCEQADINSRSEFKKHGAQPLLTQN